MRTIFSAIVFCALAILAASGEIYSQELEVVKMLSSGPVSVAQGREATLTVRAKIKKGYHLQANPAAEEFLIPTTLKMQANDSIVPGEPVYPPGQPHKLMNSEDVLLTYDDELTIRLPVKVMDSAQPGDTSLTGELKFQACDDRRCFYPRSVAVVIPLRIVPEQ